MVRKNEGTGEAGLKMQRNQAGHGQAGGLLRPSKLRPSWSLSSGFCIPCNQPYLSTSLYHSLEIPSAGNFRAECLVNSPNTLLLGV